MKLFSRFLLAAAMLVSSAAAVVVPTAPALAGPELFAVCNPATPNSEPYRRPGGFCEAVANLKSIMPQGHDPIYGKCPEGEHDASMEADTVCVPDAV